MKIVLEIVCKLQTKLKKMTSDADDQINSETKENKKKVKESVL